MKEAGNGISSGEIGEAPSNKGSKALAWANALLSIDLVALLMMLIVIVYAYVFAINSMVHTKPTGGETMEGWFLLMLMYGLALVLLVTTALACVAAGLLHYCKKNGVVVPKKLRVLRTINLLQIPIVVGCFTLGVGIMYIVVM